jgi:hypothetical protein
VSRDENRRDMPLSKDRESTLARKDCARGHADYYKWCRGGSYSSFTVSDKARKTGPGSIVHPAGSEITDRAPGLGKVLRRVPDKILRALR